MSNIIVLDAICVNEFVKINNDIVVPETSILSDGKASSTGILIINDEKKIYIAIPIDSIKAIIDNISSLCDILSTGILASNGGGAITSPTFTTNLTALKNTLTALKGNLQ